jgi:ketosteroid isomerase-like protein
MVATQNLGNDVWSQEVAYWDYLKAADLDHLLSLWHEDGVGWPEQPSPLNIAAARPLFAEVLASLQLESCTFELRPISVRVYNNSVCITHYEAHKRLVTKDGAEIASHTKCTHTWLRTENGWKMIGGMEAPLARP